MPIRIPTLDLSGLTAPKDVCGNEAIENKNDEDGQQMDDGEVIGSAKTSEGISSIRELEIEGPIDRLEQRKESTDNTKDDSGNIVFWWDSTKGRRGPLEQVFIIFLL